MAAAMAASSAGWRCPMKSRLFSCFWGRWRTVTSSARTFPSTAAPTFRPLRDQSRFGVAKMSTIELLANRPAHVPEASVYDFDIFRDAALFRDPHERARELQKEAPPVFWT